MSIEDDIDQELMSVAQDVAKRLAEPTKTWRHKVTFRIIGPFNRGKDRVVKIITEDPPYFWLDGGAIKHARMKRGFGRKTDPNSFVARPGSPPFDPAYHTKKSLGKIAARNWTELTAQEKQMELQVALNRAMAKYQVGKATSKSVRKPYFTP